MLVPLLLNWYANPYHTPIIVAYQKGLYADLGIDLCILEPDNPSDVTKIIGQGHIPLGLKAMIHCYAARNRGYPISSIGTLLDEPPTGLITPLEKNINDIKDLEGKRIGFVGEFGKVMVDNLTKAAGLSPESYETIRIGMHASNAIIENHVDAAIGLSCFQQIEVEEAGIPTRLLRIDQAANLGCCCFCSILYIVHERFRIDYPDVLKNFMIATKKGAQITREEPKEAFNILIKSKPHLNNTLYYKIFQHCLPFFSKDCLNNEKDWEKVGDYAKNLGILKDFSEQQAYYTNEFVPLQGEASFLE